MIITLLGAGNVARHLGVALFQKGFQIQQVYSREFHHASSLAFELAAQPCNHLDQIAPGADAYLFMLRDDALLELAGQLSFSETIFIHTSGTVGLDVFKDHLSGSAVLYPLQSFSASAPVDLAVVPIFLEADSDYALTITELIAGAISSNIHFANSDTRKVLHLAAVFAANFSNHLFTIAAEILSLKNLPFDVLGPLINHTVEKALHTSPFAAQTGPAVRGDEAVIAAHLALLPDDSPARAIYEALTDSIRASHAKKALV